MRGLRLMAVSLATLRVVETVKEILPIVPHPALKSSVSLGVAAGITWLAGERDPAVLVTDALAAAGAASLWHDIQDSMRRFTDTQVAEVIQRVPRRPAPLGPLGGN